jgi:hypothetical protein
MAATAGLSLTLDPMGEMFQNASSLKPLGQFRSRHFEFHTGTKNVMFSEDHPMNIHVQFGFNHKNDHWKVLYKVSGFFMPIGNPRWPRPQYID